MQYSKPQIIEYANATDLIQGSLDKFINNVEDSTPDAPRCSQPAYEADE